MDYMQQITIFNYARFVCERKYLLAFVKIKEIHWAHTIRGKKCKLRSFSFGRVTT